jgi:hypothetical protein
MDNNANNANANADAIERQYQHYAAVGLGIFEVLVGVLVVVLGMRQGDMNSTKTGVKAMQQGLGGVLDGLEDDGVEWAKIGEQIHRILTHAVRLQDLAVWGWILDNLHNHPYLACTFVALLLFLAVAIARRWNANQNANQIENEIEIGVGNAGNGNGDENENENGNGNE